MSRARLAAGTSEMQPVKSDAIGAVALPKEVTEEWEEPRKEMRTRVELDPATGQMVDHRYEVNMPLPPIVSNPAGASAAALNPENTEVKEEMDVDAQHMYDASMAPPVGETTRVSRA